MHIIALLLFGIAWLSACDARSMCEVVASDRLTPSGDPGLSLQCEINGYLGNNPNLDEAMRATKKTGNVTSEILSFDEFASDIVEIKTKIAGTMIIRTNALSCCPNVLNLEITLLRDEIRLNISANEFDNIPNLTSLYMFGFVMTDDIDRAISNLKGHRMQNLTIVYIKLAKSAKFLNQLQEFTNLKYLQIYATIGGPYSNEVLPPNSLRGSAVVLEEITLGGIRIPTITKDMFRGMRKLKKLFLRHNTILTIETGAFDDLIALEEFHLEQSQELVEEHQLNHSSLQILPNNLFKNTKKLKQVTVNFYGGSIENLSRDNFTHVEGFEELVID